jgi:aminoglycoside 6'-N-acetyltransferase I
MNVRLAVPADLDAIVAMQLTLWTDADADEQRHEASLTIEGRPRSTLPLVIFVAARGARVTGFIEVGLRSHADGCDARRACGFIEGWYVEPDCRAQGVGRRLVEQAETWARDQGCTEMGSDTWIDNDGSVRAHTSLGYVVVDRCVNFRKTL